MSAHNLTARSGRELLDIPSYADRPAVRRAVLERLQNWGFVPSSDELEAIYLVLGIADPDPDTRETRQLQLRAEVDSFCMRFWTRSLQERTQEWEDLYDQCADSPPLRARMQLLRPALDFEISDLTHESPVVLELARLLCELCTLPPPARVAHRRARLDPLRHVDAAALGAAAAYLQVAYPDLAQFDQGECLREAAQRAVPKRLLRMRHRRAAPSWIRWLRPVHPAAIPPPAPPSPAWAAFDRATDAFERVFTKFARGISSVLILLCLAGLFFLIFVEPSRRAEETLRRAPAIDPAVRQEIMDYARRQAGRPVRRAPDQALKRKAFEPLIRKLLNEHPQAAESVPAELRPPASPKIEMEPVLPETADE